MSRNAISANPEQYLFKPEGLKKFFLAAALLQKIFWDRLPPKQKILDRTLPATSGIQCGTFLESVIKL